MDRLDFSKVNVNEELQVFGIFEIHLQSFSQGTSVTGWAGNRTSESWPTPLLSSGYLNTMLRQIHCPEAQVHFCSMCISIWNTYCHEQFLHTVRGHTVQMGQMKLEMHFVAEDILAEGAADNRLHWMLWQDMHLDTIWVPTIVVTIRTLIELKKIKMKAISQCAFCNLLILLFQWHIISVSFLSYLKEFENAIKLLHFLLPAHDKIYCPLEALIF